MSDAINRLHSNVESSRHWTIEKPVKSWSVRVIAPEMPQASSRQSFGLCAAIEPARIYQETRETSLAAGDFSVLDLALPYVVEGGALRLLDFGDRTLGHHLGSGQKNLGCRIDGCGPMGKVLNNLLNLLDSFQLVDRRDLGDGLIPTIVSIISTLALPKLPSGTTPYRLGMLQRAQTIVAAQIHNPKLRVETLAEALGISPRHLTNVFLPTNYNPQKYITIQRVNRAMAMLREVGHERRSIARVAEKCGFTDQSHFSRVFRNHVHMTPSKFREEVSGHCRTNAPCDD